MTSQALFPEEAARFDAQRPPRTHRGPPHPPNFSPSPGPVAPTVAKRTVGAKVRFSCSFRSSRSEGGAPTLESPRRPEGRAGGHPTIRRRRANSETGKSHVSGEPDAMRPERARLAAGRRTGRAAYDEAEGMGLEPTTPYGAADFESASSPIRIPSGSSNVYSCRPRVTSRPRGPPSAVSRRLSSPLSPGRLCSLATPGGLRVSRPLPPGEVAAQPRERVTCQPARRKNAMGARPHPDAAASDLSQGER